MRVRFGQFVLDSEARQLLHGEKEVHVSPKAFNLLCALIARRPAVVTKDDLFKHLWPDTFVVDANLNVLVGEIRRAIGDDAQSPRFVRTAHGVGYAFCGDVVESGDARAEVTGKTRFWLTWRDRSFVLSPGDNVIGRDPQCDVWLDHAGVSRRHARIRIPTGPERAVVDDLDSTNGTFVGRRRVQSEVPVTDGDVITVGSVDLKFRAWSDTSARTRRLRGKAR